eukprot:g6181.t1
MVETEMTNVELREGIELSKGLMTALQAAQSFSRNESVDEIPTSDLKFLLVPYYYGTLLTRLNCDETENKIKNLQEANELINGFLSQLWEYGLCGELATKMFRDENALLKTGVRENAELQRNRKIQRLRRERYLKGEIDRFEKLSKTKEQFERDDSEYSWVDGLHEEHERRVWILLLEMTFLKATTERELIQKELQLLQFALTQPKLPDVSPTVPSQLHSIVDQLQKRQSIRSQVFRPSHILPTMTVEQFGALEKQRAEQREEAMLPQEGDVEDGSDGEDVYKARAWDDWKDDHPRGYGNSKMKPCAQ